MTNRCPTCSSGFVLLFDHVALKAGWWCRLCNRWADSSVA